MGGRSGGWKRTTRCGTPGCVPSSCESDGRASGRGNLPWRPGSPDRHRYTFLVPPVSTLGVFVGAAIALLLTPGPAVLYIVTRSIEEGRLAGLVSVLGICTGTLVHVVAATLGLSALLVSSALAFTTVKYLGAAYLVVLG